MQQNPVQVYNFSGKLGIIGMKGCEDLVEKVDRYLMDFCEGGGPSPAAAIPVNCPRFGTGEAKAVVLHSVRTYDIYIICDPFNYGVTYKMYGVEHSMSPDDHFQD